MNLKEKPQKVAGVLSLLTAREAELMQTQCEITGINLQCAL